MSTGHSAKSGRPALGTAHPPGNSAPSTARELATVARNPVITAECAVGRRERQAIGRVRARAPAVGDAIHAGCMAVYAAQIDRMDRGIGRILTKLRQLGIEGNTLVMFLSDNGAEAELI
ncbi:MAG TPA: sulfatase-like hydrolase/transferase, partial [Phycisphaerae bacterium]|nr:sulfatase-like hydrolase/transferase [Phycisphaerae bacterium]